MGVAMAGGIFYGKETVGAKNFSKNVQVAIGNSEKLSVGNKSNSIKWTVVSGKNNIKIVLDTLPACNLVYHTDLLHILIQHMKRIDRLTAGI